VYDYTDKIIRYLNKQFIRIFSEAKSVLPVDELNILQYSKAMYGELEKVTEKALLKLARHVYKKHSQSGETDITLAWLLGFLKEANPVTKYIYLNEVERKRSRFIESLIASENRAKEIDTALRFWVLMVNQYAIDVTDAAVIQAYIDVGVEKVVWITTVDERRCDVCRKRHGVVYGIDDVPPKPHWGCRCYVVPRPGRDDG